MLEIDEKAIIERIIEVRTRFAGPRGKSKFAHAIGISPSTYNYYENDRLPPIPVMLQICDLTKCDLYWLLTGKSSQKGLFVGSNSEIYQKIGHIIEKRPEMANAIIAFVDLLAEKNQPEETGNSETKVSDVSNSNIKTYEYRKSKPDWIPVLGRTAAGMVGFWSQTTFSDSKKAIVELDSLVEKHAGKAIEGKFNGEVSVDFQSGRVGKSINAAAANLVQINNPDDRQVVEFVESQEIQRLYPDCFALRIDGDSMSPRINDGDVVVLSPSVPAMQGQPAVVHLQDQIGVTCKLIRTAGDKVHLIPINERYETKVVPAEKISWALAVLCHIKL